MGTQRRSALTEEDVRLCVRSSESEDGTGSLGNYEQRMAAEIHLYWTTYQNCTAQRVPAREAIMALEKWKEEWAILFRESKH